MTDYTAPTGNEIIASWQGEIAYTAPDGDSIIASWYVAPVSTDIAPPPRGYVLQAYSLSAYISGAENSLDDYYIPISSFGMSKRDAATSYYSISAPFSDSLLTALIDREDGVIHILRNGSAWESFNVSHPIQFDIGPRSASISINGTRQETNATPASINIEPYMAISDGVNSSGLRSIELLPGIIDPRPGDSITWDGSGYTVTLVKFQANASGQTLSINAT